jgi:hypothetical protein
MASPAEAAPTFGTTNGDCGGIESPTSIAVFESATDEFGFVLTSPPAAALVVTDDEVEQVSVSAAHSTETAARSGDDGGAVASVSSSASSHTMRRRFRLMTAGAGDSAAAVASVGADSAGEAPPIADCTGAGAGVCGCTVGANSVRDGATAVGRVRSGVRRCFFFVRPLLSLSKSAAPEQHRHRILREYTLTRHPRRAGERRIVCDHLRVPGSVARAPIPIPIRFLKAPLHSLRFRFRSFGSSHRNDAESVQTTPELRSQSNPSL